MEPDEADIVGRALSSCADGSFDCRVDDTLPGLAVRRGWGSAVLRESPRNLLSPVTRRPKPTSRLYAKGASDLVTRFGVCHLARPERPRFRCGAGRPWRFA